MEQFRRKCTAPTPQHAYRCPKTPYAALKSAASIFEHRNVCEVGNRALPSYGPSFVATKKQVAWRRRLQEDDGTKYDDTNHERLDEPLEWDTRPGAIQCSTIPPAGLFYL